MAGTLKKVRFILAWQQYQVGDIIEPNGVLRDWLVANGYAEVIDTGTVTSPLTRDSTGMSRVKSAAKRLLG